MLSTKSTITVCTEELTKDVESNLVCWWIVPLIVFLTVYPPVVSLLQQDIVAPFTYFAADAFSYLTVANHSVNSPFYTYDGLSPTNGFHPLWQYYLTFCFQQLDSKRLQIFFTFYSCLLFSVIGLSLVGLALLRLTHSGILAVLGTVPGLYYWLFPAHQHYGATWSFLNGMESSLSILIFGIIVYLLVVKELARYLSSPKVILISGLLSLLTLSRLDEIFIFLPWLVFLILFSRSKLKHLLVATLVPGLIIGAYLVYNLSYAEMALPVSGTIKAGFSFNANWRAFSGVLVPLTQMVNPHWHEVAWRLLQMLVPFALALFWVVNFLLQNSYNHQEDRSGNRSSGCYTHSILTLLAGYVILKALYNFVAVYFWHQGHWYFPLSIIIFNMIAVSLIPYRKTPLFLLIAILVTTMLLANDFTFLKTKDYNKHYARFFLAGERISKELRTHYQGVGIVEFDDGILGYSLAIPTMGGLGFTLDKEAYQAYQRGHLLEIAYQRGFRVFASLNYFHVEQKELPFFLMGQDLSKWKFSVVYQDEDTKVAFLEFSPK